MPACLHAEMLACYLGLKLTLEPTLRPAGSLACQVHIRGPLGLCSPSHVSQLLALNGGFRTSIHRSGWMCRSLHLHVFLVLLWENPAQCERAWGSFVPVEVCLAVVMEALCTLLKMRMA